MQVKMTFIFQPLKLSMSFTPTPVDKVHAPRPKVESWTRHWSIRATLM